MCFIMPFFRLPLFSHSLFDQSYSLFASHLLNLLAYTHVNKTEQISNNSFPASAFHTTQYKMGNKKKGTEWINKKKGESKYK